VFNPYPDVPLSRPPRRFENLPITVSESGEDLYVRPYALRFPARKHMHFEYVQISEFWPYKNHWQDFLVDAQTYFDSEISLSIARIVLFWHLSARRFFCAFWLALKDAADFSLFPRVRLCPHFWLWYGGLYPLYCYSFSDCCFSLPHQLRIDDPADLTDDCYLRPSDKYIASRIARLENGECESYNREDLERYRVWRASLPEDVTVSYMVELNT